MPKRKPKFSAGITRGLIEAPRVSGGRWRRNQRFPRGLPAASLKLEDAARCVLRDRVFRGDYPRPH